MVTSNFVVLRSEGLTARKLDSVALKLDQGFSSANNLLLNICVDALVSLGCPEKDAVQFVKETVLNSEPFKGYADIIGCIYGVVDASKKLQ